MKYLLGFLLFTSPAIVTRAQQPTPSASGNQKLAASDFLAQVQQELARYSHGVMLYRRCDVFARMINARVAARLGLESSSVRNSTMSEEADTAYEGDISHPSIDQLGTPEQNETTIAINRKNPALIVAGANDASMNTLSMPAFVSTDGGDNWSTFRVPAISDDMYAGGDPIMIADDSGNFYYAFLIEGNASSLSDVMVAKSSDGKRWTLGTPVLGLQDSGAFEDKENIAIDREPGSPYHGCLYMAWNEYDTSGAIRHLLAFSDNQAQTWSSPRSYTTQFGYFPLVRTGKNGTVFIASSTQDDTDMGSGNSHGMTVSTDGGATFSEHTIANYTLYPLAPGGYPSLKGKDGFRAFPYVAYDVDSSANSLDAVFGNWNNANSNAELFAVHSSDEGSNWTDPAPVGTPALLGNDHFMPWVSYDASAGETYISMYSSEEDTIANLRSRAVLSTFSSTNRLLTLGSRLFDPLFDTIVGTNFIGDYTGNDAYAGSFAAAWTEVLPPNHPAANIFAYVSSSPLISRPYSPSGVTRQINAQNFGIASIVPNPASGNLVTFNILSNAQLSATVRIFDLRGVEVLTSQAMMDPAMQNVVTLDIHSLPAGVFHAQVSCGRQLAESNFVILR
jgi:hypothetical protein